MHPPSDPTPCTLIWYSDEPYRQAISRAVHLARAHNQAVSVLDSVSGRTVRYVTPETGFYAKKK